MRRGLQRTPGGRLMMRGQADQATRLFWMSITNLRQGQPSGAKPERQHTTLACVVLARQQGALAQSCRPRHPSCSPTPPVTDITLQHAVLQVDRICPHMGSYARDSGASWGPQRMWAPQPCPSALP